MALVKADKTKEFFDGTTIHGLSHIFGQKRKHYFVWSVLILICFSMLIWMTVNSIKLYQQNNVTTSFVYNTLPETNFPGITFCNENIFQKKLVGINPLLVSLLNIVNMLPEIGHDTAAEVQCNFSM